MVIIGVILCMVPGSTPLQPGTILPLSQEMADRLPKGTIALHYHHLPIPRGWERTPRIVAGPRYSEIKKIDLVVR